MLYAHCGSWAWHEHVWIPCLCPCLGPLLTGEVGRLSVGSMAIPKPLAETWFRLFLWAFVGFFYLLW